MNKRRDGDEPLDLEVVDRAREKALDPADEANAVAAQEAVAKLVRERPGALDLRFTAVKVSKVNLPMLPPDYLREYEAVIPGFAERAAKQWEADREHRRTMEKEKQDADNKARARDLHIEWWRVNYAFVLGLLGLLVAGGLAYSGRETGATVLGAISVASMVGSFLRRRRRDRDVGEK